MIYILLVISIILIIIGVISTRDNILSPSVITSSIWFFCLSLFIFLPHNLYPLSNKFFIALLLWIVLLSLSSLLVQQIDTKQNKDIKTNRLIRNIYLIICVIALIHFLFWVYNVLDGDFSSNWAKKLRLFTLGLNGGEPYKGIHVFIWQISLLLELYYFDKKKWFRFILPFFCFLTYSFFIMSKGTLLSLFVMTVCVLYFKKIIKVRYIFVGLISLFFLFIFLQNIRESEKTDKTYFTTLYLLSSMSAFETVEPNSSSTFGENTFRTFYKVTQKLGLTKDKPENFMLDFVKVPIHTNTYTCLYPFYKDFGLMGVAIFAIITGVILGYIFAKAKSGNLFFIVLYSYLLNSLVMQFSSELLFAYIAGTIKFIAFLSIPFIVEKYKLLNIKSKKK